MNESKHIPVLLHEVIEGLLARRSLGEGGNRKVVILDATFGGGGHSNEIRKRFPLIRLVTIDQDERTEADYHTNFRNLDEVLQKEGIKKIDAIIFDLGLSTDQLESSGRGFSFQKDEPLLMTFNPESSLTAETIVNRWSEESLADIIYGYGEERQARKIARAIAKERKRRPIKTTRDLVDIIESVVPRSRRIHPATKTFQALRIAANDELGALREGLKKGFAALKEGGRMAVISFHSLEDRIVKNFFKDTTKEGKGILINKKPITPSESELKENPKSRSAKLRIIEKK